MSQLMYDAFEIPPEMVPISGLNTMFPYVSPARQVMFTGNLAQANVIKGATRKRMRSGLEKEAAKGTFKHQFDRESIVLAVIPRFTSLKYGERFNLNPHDLIIFEDYETSQLDCLELNKFHVMHQHYGFRYHFDDDFLTRIKTTKNARVKAGTVVARSPNITDDGDYKYGLETNVCMVSDPTVTEDAVWYSDSYSKQISTTGYESRIITCGHSHYPINAYGNAEEYKPIPDIGERIHSNGLICALRPYDQYLDAIYMSGKKLFKPVYGMDIPTYGVRDATVVDIRVLHNDRLSNPRMPEIMGEQFRKYYDADKRYYMEIVKTCLMRSGRFMNDNPNLSPRLNALLFQAIAICGEDLVAEGIWPKSDIDALRAQKNYRGEILDEFRVEIIFEYETELGEGPKVTDLSGGKGVSARRTPDADMPRDEFGNAADIVIFSGSTVNRMNPGRTHEQAVGAAGRDVIKRIRRSYGLPDMGVIPMDVIERVVLGSSEQQNRNNFDYLMGFYKIVTPKTNYAKLSKPEVTASDRWLRHLIQIIKDGDEPHGLFLQIPSNSGVRMDKVIEEIEKGPYMPEMGPITYRDHSGKMVTTVKPVLIGPNYYLVLEKTATDWSGISSSKVNHFGVTARLTNADKYSSPGRQTGTRAVDEASARNIAKAMGAEPLAHLMDMNNNPVVHKEVCRAILTAEYPTNIDKVIDRSKFKLGGHRPLAYVIHQLICSGKGISRE